KPGVVGSIPASPTKRISHLEKVCTICCGAFFVANSQSILQQGLDFCLFYLPESRPTKKSYVPDISLGVPFSASTDATRCTFR
ncbi:MAG: hypothetical protein WB424_03640, partial [Terracidiphilus sp.]